MIIETGHPIPAGDQVLDIVSLKDSHDPEYRAVVVALGETSLELDPVQAIRAAAALRAAALD